MAVREDQRQRGATIGGPIAEFQGRVASGHITDFNSGLRDPANADGPFNDFVACSAERIATTLADMDGMVRLLVLLLMLDRARSIVRCLRVSSNIPRITVPMGILSTVLSDHKEVRVMLPPGKLGARFDADCRHRDILPYVSMDSEQIVLIDTPGIEVASSDPERTRVALSCECEGLLQDLDSCSTFNVLMVACKQLNDQLRTNTFKDLSAHLRDM